MNPLSVIIPVFNKAELTLTCLHHLSDARDRDREMEVLVIDNGSTDDTPMKVQRNAPWARVISLGANHGFAAAVNAGFQHSKLGNDFLVMNNDVFPDPGFEAGIEKTMADHAGQRIGFVGAKLRFPNGLIQHAGAFLNNLGNGQHRGGFPDWGQYDQYIECEYVAFAMTYIPLEAFMDIGFMDDTYFLYYEDVDYAYSAREKGWKVIYSPHMSGIHFHNQTGRTLGKENVRHENVSKQIFMQKWVVGKQ